MNNEPLRPDPDRLLEQTAAPHRGKLKVFFGACAGVGKTWAMLAEAQRLAGYCGWRGRNPWAERYRRHA